MDRDEAIKYAREKLKLAKLRQKASKLQVPEEHVVNESLPVDVAVPQGPACATLQRKVEGLAAEIPETAPEVSSEKSANGELSPVPESSDKSAERERHSVCPEVTGEVAIGKPAFPAASQLPSPPGSIPEGTVGPSAESAAFAQQATPPRRPLPPPPPPKQATSSQLVAHGAKKVGASPARTTSPERFTSNTRSRVVFDAMEAGSSSPPGSSSLLPSSMGSLPQSRKSPPARVIDTETIPAKVPAKIEPSLPPLPYVETLPPVAASSPVEEQGQIEGVARSSINLESMSKSQGNLTDVKADPAALQGCSTAQVDMETPALEASVAHGLIKQLKTTGETRPVEKIEMNTTIKAMDNLEKSRAGQLVLQKLPEYSPAMQGSFNGQKNSVDSAVEELTKVRRLLEKNQRSDDGVLRDMIRIQDQAPLDYMNSWPEVECGISVRDISNFNLVDGTYSADVAVRLDWLDEKLQERVHYFMDAKSGRWQLCNSVAADSDFLFDPSVYIENARESLLIEQDSDTVPRIEGMRPASDADQEEIPWLTKSFRFRAILQVPLEVNAARFPFDVHRVFINVQSRPLQGLTSLGKQRSVRLVNPALWTEQRLRRLSEAKMENEHSHAGPELLYALHSSSRLSLDTSREHSSREYHKETLDMVTHSMLVSGIFKVLDTILMVPVRLFQYIASIVMLIIHVLIVLPAVVLMVVLSLPFCAGVCIQNLITGNLKKAWNRYRAVYKDLHAGAQEMNRRASNTRRKFMNFLVGKRGSTSSDASSSAGSASDTQLKILVTYETTNFSEMPWHQEFRLMGGMGIPVYAAGSIRGQAFQSGLCEGDVLLTINGVDVESAYLSGEASAASILESTKLEGGADSMMICSPADASSDADCVTLVFKRSNEFLTELQEHSWQAQNADGGLQTTIGEMEVLLYCGSSKSDDTYQFEIFLSRGWTKYLFDCFIQIMQIVIALTSLWVPFTDDMLAGRLSIALAIMLTLVVFTKERPTVIQELPFATAQDEFEQKLVLMSAIIAVENVLVFDHCWGFEGPNDTYSVSPQENSAHWTVEQQDPEFESSICHLSPLRTSWADTIFLIGMMAVTFFIGGQLLVGAHVWRVKKLVQFLRRTGRRNGVQRKIHSLHNDKERGGIVHRFVTSNANDAELLARIQVLPNWLMPLPFLPIMNSCIWMKLALGFMDPILSNGGNNDSETSDLTEAESVKTRLAPHDVTRIVDIGGAEIGFYSFWMRSLGNGSMNSTRRQLQMQQGLGWAVRNTGSEKKFKMHRASFLDEFVEPVEGEEDGARRFGELLIKHYPVLNDVLAIDLGKNNHLIRIGWTSDSTLPLLRSWLRLVKKTLHQDGIQCDFEIIDVRPDLEAKCEIIASEWLVQYGNLSCIGLLSNNSTEQFALIELQQAFFSMKQNTSLGGVKESMDLASFVQQFRDLRIPFNEVEAVFESAKQSDDNLDESLLQAFYRSDVLMRALIRARLFAGLLSAGGSHCQASYNAHLSGCNDRHGKVPLCMFQIGNATPLSMVQSSGQSAVAHVANMAAERHVSEYGAKLWAKGEVVTHAMVDDWRSHIIATIKQMKMPRASLRGLFVGISAIFYAANDAGVGERLLPRDDFLAALEKKLAQLLKDPPKGEDRRRIISNLVLASELSRGLLHHSAWVVCKRVWRLDRANDEAGTEFVATWALGWWLRQTQLLL